MIFDPDGDILTIESVSNAVNGSVVIDAVTKTVTFSPDNDYVGLAAFDYSASDGSLTTIATASVQVLDEDVVIGTPGDDDIAGRRGDENTYLVFGLGGDDYIHGFFGDNNLIYGGDGNDSLTAHGDFDILYGGPGDDYLRATILSDATLHGGIGDDYLSNAPFGSGGPGNDVLWGEGRFPNSYTYNLGDGVDTIIEEYTGLPSRNNTIQFGPGIEVPESWAFDGSVARFEGIDILFEGRAQNLFYFDFADGTHIHPDSIPVFADLQGLEFALLRRSRNHHR